MHNRILIFFLTAFLSLPQILPAQDNVLKINLPNLVNRHFTLHYERAFHERMSIGGIVGFTPSRDLPGSNFVRNYFIDLETTNFSLDGEYTKFALTPEFRFYILNRKDAPAGLYASLAFRYARHAFDLPFGYDRGGGDFQVIDLDARIHTIGGTLGLGYQLFALDRISVDLYLAAGLATAPIRLKASSNVLTSDDYIELRDSVLDELGLEVKPERLERWLSNQGLNMAFALPLPLGRTGISIGYRF
jgi:hypothetical protein